MIRISKRGFTMVELALAMAFISFLLLMIGITIAQLTGLYQRGVILEQVNNIGRELVDEFTHGVNASVYEDELITKTSDFYFEYGAELPEQTGVDGQVPLYGAFCTGMYTYIWNTGYALGLGAQTIQENPLLAATWQNAEGTKTIENFRLLRVGDSGRTICNNYNETLGMGAPTSKLIGGDGAVEILPASNSDLALYDFKTFKPAYDKFSNHALYSATFILGTIGRGVDITASGDFCKTGYGGQFITDFTYCAVNKFNFAARATGGISYGN
ncbi:hypothetical protein IJ103_02475 [Candidatus Saccharibacteria bacterium]|nr:hypothetical protein [Candidatus Saccharibacteria bacterium]